MRFVCIQFRLVVDTLCLQIVQIHFEGYHRWLERNEYLLKQDARPRKRKRDWDAANVHLRAKKSANERSDQQWLAAGWMCLIYFINGIWLTLKASARRRLFQIRSHSAISIRTTSQPYIQHHKPMYSLYKLMQWHIRDEIWNMKVFGAASMEEHFHCGTIAIKMFPHSDWRDLVHLFVFSLIVECWCACPSMDKSARHRESNLSGPSSFKSKYHCLDETHTHTCAN